MVTAFPSRTQLRRLPLERLRLVDVHNPEEEKLLQEVVDEKLADKPVPGDVNRLDVPDIKTPEEEAKWQKIIDARALAAKGKRHGKKSVEIMKKKKADTGTPVPSSKPPEVKDANMVEYTLTQADLDRNPEAVKNGAKVGDKLMLPKDSLPQFLGQTTNTPAPAATTRTRTQSKRGGGKNTEKKETKPFCEFCDSKGGFHKQDCPTRDVA